MDGLGGAHEAVSFATEDGGVVHADVYGKGQRGLVLAHGGRLTKGRWEKQARELAAADFLVVAIDFRGYGQSRGTGPIHLDELAAARHLRKRGAKTVAAVGGSMGGGAAAEAMVAGGIERLVMLAAERDPPPENMRGRKLVIVARDDAHDAGPRLPRIRAHYDRMPEPKEMIVLEGSAHAQFLFQTDQGEPVMREILQFLLKQ